ncbi:MAG: hypothetical protein JXB47_06685 [Anaerolineae bacterium]|nr:hypothetical protein [Anaerolineae bacterium]
MKDRLLLGYGRFMIPVPRIIWQRIVYGRAQKDEASIASKMSREHHLIRDFVVREIPRVNEPLSPEHVAQSVNLPLEQVAGLMGELERGKVFLWRNEQGAAIWAYPVTVDATPHRVSFSTGEQGHAA